MQTNNIEQYKIHELNLVSLQEKIEKLNKRARKIGVSEIEINVVGKEAVTDKKTKQVETYITIELKGETPKLNGWRFLARVETVKEQKNLLYVVPNENVPIEYRNTGSQCNHCESKRYRKYTYVLQHDNGEYKQVGSSCLKDFLGHENPHSHAQWLEHLEDLKLFIEDCEEYEHEEQSTGGYGYRSKISFDLMHYVSMVAEYIKQVGYFTSRTKAQEEEFAYATCDAVWNEMTNHKLKYENRVVKEISEESKEMAVKAIKWAIDLKNDEKQLSDYQHNLQLSCEENMVNYRNMGIVASVITSYQYAMNLIEKKEKQMKEYKTSEFVGTVGKREEFTLTIVKIKGFSTQFGYSELREMKDELGNKFVWFSATGDYKEGDKVVFKATVKEHKVYNDTKQTVLTRCTALKKYNKQSEAS